MNNAYTQFLANTDKAVNLVNLAKVLDDMTSSAIDVSDIYRAAIVQVVSALDQFIHEIVRVGLLEIYKGTRKETASSANFPIPLSAVMQGAIDEYWLDQRIRHMHSWKAFQDPDKIAEAIALICPTGLWDKVGKIIESEAKTLRIDLKAIVDRRNQIAHEADMHPINIGEYWPITRKDTENTIEKIKSVASAILDVTTS